MIKYLLFIFAFYIFLVVFVEICDELKEINKNIKLHSTQF